MKTVLFDGDVLLYMAGFAVETRYYTVNGLDCVGKKDAFSKAQELLKGKRHAEVKINFDIDSKDFEHAEGALKAVIRRTLVANNTGSYKIVLSDPDSSNIFRYQLDPNYKANRQGSLKPLHWKELHTKAVQGEYGEVIISKGMEADDELGILMTADANSICASIDKDLLMVPGLHYNLRTGKFVEASDPGAIWIEERSTGKKDLKGYGTVWFWAQMLMGDPVDNIIGLTRYGAVKTYNALKASEKLVGGAERVVRALYKETNDPNLERFELNKKLLWIRRERNETTA